MVVFYIKIQNLSSDKYNKLKQKNKPPKGGLFWLFERADTLQDDL